MSYVAFALFSFIVCMLLGPLLKKMSFLHEKKIVTQGVIPPSNDYYLAYSNGAVDDYVLYHDMDHVMNYVKKADVLFLGNSRVKHAFLRDTLAPFFRAKSLKYYVMGFGYVESVGFPKAIMEKYSLHPKWVVVNADPHFFASDSSLFASKVMKSTSFDGWKFRFETETSYQVRRRLHHWIPELLPVKRAADWIEFRSISDGTLFLSSYDGEERAVVTEGLGNQEFSKSLETARQFKKLLDENGTTMVMTVIPPSPSVTGRAIAKALGVTFLEPNVEGLETIDGSHLNHFSANRFSEAFLAQFNDVILHEKVPKAFKAPLHFSMH